MSPRRRIRTLLACTALATLATPALAETIYIETSPADTVYTPPTTYYYYTAPSTVVYEEPSIVVTAPRGDEDAMINNDVVGALAADPNLSGRIGVETRDREVELSGVVTTDGQSMRAERDAMSVDGVRTVHNGLATRIGPHTH